MNTPFQLNEEKRLEALRRYDVLGPEREPIFDDITRLLAYVCKTPASSISFVDHDRLWFKSEYGLGTREIKREGSFCTYCILQDKLFIVEDAKKHPFFASYDPVLIFYAGAPIETPDHYPIGTVNVIDFVPRSINNEQGDLLLFMARQVMAHLELKFSLKQQKIAEEFNRSILESTQDCIQIIDLEGKVLATKKGTQGCPELEGARAKRGLWIDLWSTESKPTVQEAYLKAKEGEIVRFQARSSLLGGVYWWDVILTPMRLPEGGTSRLLAVARDITKSKSLEEKLRESKQAAEHASKAKDDFMAILSHELRTPLAPVLIAASYVEKQSHLNEDQHKALEIIRHNVELEARLIDDLLDLTRIVQGKITLERQPLDLRVVLDRVVEICRPEFETKGLKFRYELEEGKHLLNGDAARLQQVFWNLLKNAIKFTPRGGEIKMRCFAKGGKELVTEVTDTGSGFEPSAEKRIFNAFEQAAPDIAKQFGGLGLGLAISKRIVEMHDGTIDGHSAGKGKGAAFTVHLPQIDSVPEEVGSGSHRPIGSWERKLKILVVEDHRDTSKILSLALNSLGHEVRTAETAEEALQLAKAEHFDLLLSDIGLPDRSGIELLSELKSAGQKLRAIAISGWGRDEDVRQSKEVGFAAHLTKPINIEELENLLTLEG